MTRSVPILALLFAVPFSIGQSFEPIGAAVHDGQWLGGPVTIHSFGIREIAPDLDQVVEFVGSDGGGVHRSINYGPFVAVTDQARSLRITEIAVKGDIEGDGPESEIIVAAATVDPVRVLLSTNSGDSWQELVIPQLTHRNDRIIAMTFNMAGGLAVASTRGVFSSNDFATWNTRIEPDGERIDDMRFPYVSKGGKLYSISGVEIPIPAPNDGLAATTSTSPTIYFSAEDPWEARAPAFFQFAFAEAAGAIYGAGGGEPVFKGRHPQRIGAHGFAERNLWFFFPGIPGGYDWDYDVIVSADGSGVEFRYSEHSPYFETDQDWAPMPTPSAGRILGVGSGYLTRFSFFTTRGVWNYRAAEPRNPEFYPDQLPEAWTNQNGGLGNLSVHFADVHSAAQAAAGVKGGGTLWHRGGPWRVVSGANGQDVEIFDDDPNLGVALRAELGPPSGLRLLENGAASFPPGGFCHPAVDGRFESDPDRPTRSCVAAGAIHCADRVTRDADWCAQTDDFGARLLRIAGGGVAWAVSDDERVWRSTGGALGTYADATGNLLAGRTIAGLVVDSTDSLRALVLAGSATDDFRVHETTDGGATWQPVGTPPVPGSVVAEPVPDCPFDPNCPAIPELAPRVTVFGGAHELLNELWFVGTSNGLLVSDDGGQSWSDTDVPHAAISDIHPARFEPGAWGPVGVATLGRGVWGAALESSSPLERHLVDCDIFCWLNLPFEPEDLWASDLVQLSGDVIAGVQRGPVSKSIFRRGDAPHGPSDFVLTGGKPLHVESDGAFSFELEGRPYVTRARLLDTGWNVVGGFGALTTASELILHAAEQGIELSIVRDESSGLTHRAGEGAATDFDLDPMRGYHLFVCGVGGEWSPPPGP